MEFTTIEIPVPHYGDNPETLICPIGDIQWAGEDESVAIGMLARHIEWGAKQGAWFVGMGDYTDAFSPSNRQAIETAAVYDTTRNVLDSAATMLVDELYERALAPSRGKWIGMLEGHHFHKFQDGTTSDQMLCNKLAAQFLGTSAYIRIRFRVEGQPKEVGQVLIWCHHGSGGGQRAGAPLNKLEMLPISFEGDIFMMGHTHKKVATPLDRIVPVFPKGESNSPARLIHRTILLVSTGGFLRGYVEECKQGQTPRGNYVEQKMLPPIALGAPIIRIRPRWKDVEVRSEGKRVSHSTLWVPDLSVEL